MVEFLAGVVAEILDHTHIFESAILLQLMDAMGAQREILFDLAIVGVPKLPVMAGRFDDELMRCDRLHSGITAIAGADPCVPGRVPPPAGRWDGDARPHAPTRSCRSP